MGQWMDGFLEKLEKNREENLQGGGRERIDLQHSLGKLTARERIDLLADPGSFEEIGSLVREFGAILAPSARPSPSDGVVMGMARISSNGPRMAVQRISEAPPKAPGPALRPSTWFSRCFRPSL